jgi:hypothetical protein
MKLFVRKYGGQAFSPAHKPERMAWFCIALFVLLTNPGHASEWQSILTTSDGIQVFKKETGERGLIQFRGIGIVEAPLPLVATVIFDTARRREWIEGLGESRILGWRGKDKFIEYDRIEMPVFFRDRDFVSIVRMRASRAGNELVFQYQSSDDPSAPRTSYIRGEVINMTFHLSSFARGSKTRVDAAFLCDPKGLIPAWLVNYFLKDWPQTTFRNLRKEVLKPGISTDPRLSKLLKAGKQR